MSTERGGAPIIAPSEIAVLGAGSWGTALAVLLADNGHSVRLWSQEASQVEALILDRENRRYLPEIPLKPGISPTDRLTEALAGASVIVLAVPSGAIRDVALAAAPMLEPNALIISAAKGLEDRTGLRMSQVIGEAIPGSEEQVVVLSGPNLAVEVARMVPSASVAASRSAEAARAVQRLFTGQRRPTFRVYTGRDLVGVELGGAIKNVIAIGGGICDGLGFGDNSKAGLMTRGIFEAVKLGLSQGAHASTFMGLSGYGDLMATAGSRLSRNYRVGLALGQGRSLFDTLAELGQVAEGVPTTLVLCDLAERSQVDMPLCQALRSVLFENRAPLPVIAELMLRPPRSEMDEWPEAGDDVSLERSRA